MLSPGDCIMASALCQEIWSRSGRKVAFGDGSKVEWSEIFYLNPYIATPSEVAAGEPVIWIDIAEGVVPYIDYSRTYRKRQFYNEWSPRPGAIYLDQDEIEIADAAIRQITTGPFVVASPHTKNDSGGNKNWYCDRWEDVIASVELPVFQIGLPNQRILEGSFYINTKSIRQAAAVISKSVAFIGTEGALHHTAAAFNKPGVVIFGGFVHPRNTGYAIHANIHRGEPCGSRVRCNHCREIMNSITPEEVKNALNERVQGLARKSESSRIRYCWVEKSTDRLRIEVLESLPAFDFSTIMEIIEIFRRRGCATPSDIHLLVSAYIAAGSLDSAENLLNEVTLSAWSLRAKMTIAQLRNSFYEAAANGIRALGLHSTEPNHAFGHAELSAVCLQVSKALQYTGNSSLSLKFIKAAVRLSSEYYEAQWDLGLKYLTRGQYKAAIPFLNVQADVASFNEDFTRLSLPVVKLKKYCERKIVLHVGGLGLGTQLICGMYISKIANLYPNAIFMFNRRLSRYFDSLYSNTSIIDEIKVIDLIDRGEVHCQASLLAALSVAKMAEKLEPETYKRRFLTRKFDLLGTHQVKTRIGISWFAGTSAPEQRLRSISLEKWVPILRLEGVEFISLQYNFRARGNSIHEDVFYPTQEILSVENRFGISIKSIEIKCEDDEAFDRYIEVVASCDMVVAVDSFVGKLAPSLGVPTVILASVASSWPLGFQGQRSLWLPGAEIFRQSAPEDWADAIEEAAFFLGNTIRAKQNEANE